MTLVTFGGVRQSKHAKSNPHLSLINPPRKMNLYLRPFSSQVMYLKKIDFYSISYQQSSSIHPPILALAQIHLLYDPAFPTQPTNRTPSITIVIKRLIIRISLE